MRDVRHALAYVVVALVAGTPGFAAAADWDPIPELPAGRHVALASDLDRASFREMDRCLANVDSAVGAEYFAVVVEVTASSGRATPKHNNAVPYVDATYRAWTPDRRLDPDTDNIIALGLDNRAVAVHPGNRWVRLGFERGVISRTIDNSRFKTYARNGDYSKAVCTLAEAIDRRLQSKSEDLEQTKDRLQRAAKKLRQRTTKVRDSAKQVPEHSKQLIQAIDPKLEEAREKATEAFDAAGRSRISSAQSKLEAARPLLQEVENQVHRYERALQKLPAFQERHDKLSERIAGRSDADWRLPSKARSRLQTCKSKRQKIQKRLDAGNSIERAIAETENCYGSVGAILERADRIHLLWSRDIPLGAGGLLLLVLGILALVRRREHNRQVRLLEAKLSGWSDKIDNASKRLTNLEVEHGFYFEAGTEQWEGQSETLSQSCADAVNHAFLLYSEAKELYDRARELLAEAGPFALEPIEKGLHLLEDETVTFDTGTAESRRRVYLPLTQHYEGTAQQLIDDLDATYQRALNKIDKVESLLERVGELSDRASNAVARVDEAIATRRDLALPADHLVEALTTARDKVRQAKSLRANDPVRAVDLYEAHTPTVEEVADRAQRGNEMVERVRGHIASRGRRLRDRVADLRDRSYQVSEPDFDPDLRLERTERDARRVEELVRNGDETEADELFETIEPSLNQIAESLDVIESAPNTIPNDLEEIESQRSALQIRIPNAREILEGLRESHAEAAFSKQADNLEQLSKVLDDLESWIQSIRESFDATHYLSATADIEKARELLDRGTALVDGIEEVEQKLEQATDDAKTTQPEVRRSYDELRQLVAEHKNATSESVEQVVDELGRRLDTAESEMEKERPNWLKTRDALFSIRQRIEKTRPLAEQQIADWDSAKSLAGQLDADLSELEQKVEAETRDRAHVQAKVDAARRQYQNWSQSLEGSDKSGTALLRRGKNVRKAYHRAREAWQSEMELVESYRQARNDVHERINDEEGRHLGYDVYVDCSAAYSTLEQAESAADQKSWETAIERVERAREQVDRAVADAEDEYDYQQELHSTSHTTFDSTSTTSSFSSSSFSSGSSFSSSTSSVGSSFGGTSSGGGSFGGTASGGSSW